jgi:hypothetical protein
MKQKQTFEQLRAITLRAIDCQIEDLERHEGDLHGKLHVTVWIGGMLSLAARTGLIEASEARSYNARRDAAISKWADASE